jgi:protein-tyrosine phosphatase
MLHLIKEKGCSELFEIDSAGIIDYHQGELPDSRMRTHAMKRGYNLTHRARRITIDDFYNFDLILGMDDGNIDALQELAPTLETKNKISRMTDYCVNIIADHVPDPYYGGAGGFEYVLDILEDACNGILSKKCHKILIF